MLSVMEGASLGYWLLLAHRRAGFVALAGAIWIYQVYKGLGIAGYAHPVFWGAYIVTFVFWVGIAHAGTLISAILYLFRAKWRNAINRSAEAMTVFAVLTAAQFLGHPRRPDLEVLLHPAVPEPARPVGELQEPAALGHLRDHDLRDHLDRLPLRGPDPGPRDRPRPRDRAGASCSTASSRSAGRAPRAQWKSHNRSVLHLSGLATPLVLSVHSVVSWDFAVSIVPGWHATIFAPYFVAGAIFSGFAMVLTMMIPVRRIYGLEEYITDYHFENMSRFILLTSIIVGVRLRRRVLHGLVQRRRVRADRVLPARLRALLDLDLDHDPLQRRLPADALVQEGCARTSRPCSCSRCWSTSGCGSSAT